MFQITPHASGVLKLVRVYFSMSVTAAQSILSGFTQRRT